MWNKNKCRLWPLIILFFAFLLSACSEQDLANIKLLAHLKKYDQASELMIERNYRQNNPIGRDQWEAFLKVDDSDQLTAIERGLLVENQKLIIEQNKQAAIRKSAINVDPLRHNLPALEQFCQQIPKGGMLHVHPYGLLSKNIVRQILTKYNPIIDPEYFITTINNLGQKLYDHEVETLKNLPHSVKFSSYNQEQQESFINFFFLPKQPPSHDFTRFDAIFTFVIWLIEDENQSAKMQMVYLDFLKTAAAQGLSYVEFTNGFPPTLATIEKLKNWAQLFFKETGIVVRWNIGQLRFLSGEQNGQLIKQWNEILLAHPSHEIVGIDLYAIERGNPALEKAQNAYGYLNGFNQQNPIHPLEMTMHAGEMGDPRNVRDAMIMGVSRVGHGVLLKNDLISLEYARNKKLGVEMNITSNYQLNVHNMNVSPHPFLEFLRLGLSVSLSTDNNGIFDTNISKECVAAVSSTDVTYAELQAMSYNSISTSFADEKTREVLTNRLRQKFTLFELGYGH